MCFPTPSKRYYYHEEIPVREHRHHHHHHQGNRIAVPAGVSYGHPHRSSYTSVHRSSRMASPRVSTTSYRASRPVVFEERRSRY